MELDLTRTEARALGCLVEKDLATPEYYPLTLNALTNACNQKSSRAPVTNYTEGEVGHTLRELESMGLVREAWGARVPKYEKPLVGGARCLRGSTLRRAATTIGSGAICRTVRTPMQH